MVACEDTRHTQVLLRRYDIRAKHLTSYNEFNHKRKVAELVGQMDRGWDVALVTDAGTPGLSDPGEALVASGLPTREFTFVGFVPKKTGARDRLLRDLIAAGRTAVLYESPHRIGDLLADLAAVAPRARVAVARELTKVHEEIVRGTAAEIAPRYAAGRTRGEITVVIAPPSEGEPDAP